MHILSQDNERMNDIYSDIIDNSNYNKTGNKTFNIQVKVYFAE